MDRPVPACLHRRTVIAASLAMATAWRRPAHALGDIAPRLAVLDWGIAETLIALGYPPAAMAEPSRFNRAVVEPRAPETMRDLGLRLSPNPEMLALLSPTAILVNPAQMFLADTLRRFATVEAIAVYAPDRDPLEQAESAARQLAALNSDPAAAERLVQVTDTVFAACRDGIGRVWSGRVAVIRFLNGEQFELQGTNSVFAAVLKRLGLQNATTEAGRTWGTTRLGLDWLAGLGDAALVVLGPLPPDIHPTLRSTFWNEFPFVAQKRVRFIAPVWSTGGLPSASRFAHLLADAVEKEAVTP